MQSPPTEQPPRRGRVGAAAFAALLALAALLAPFHALAQTTTTAGTELPVDLTLAASIWDPRPRPDVGCPGGCAYLFGGFDGSAAVDTIYRYSPDEGTVEQVGALTTGPRYMATAAFDGEFGYIFGGYSGGGNALDEVLVFDPVANTLQTSTKLPLGLYHASAVFDGRDVWIFGGSKGAGEIPSDQIVRYNAAESRSETVSGFLPTPRAGTSAAFLDGVAYIFGGFWATTYYDDILAFNPTNPNQVQTLVPSLPTGRAFTAAVTMGGKVYVIGGANQNLVYSHVHWYDAASNTLRQLLSASLPSPRQGVAAVATDGGVLVMGGTQQAEATRTIFHILPPGATTTLVSSANGAGASTDATEGDDGTDSPGGGTDPPSFLPWAIGGLALTAAIPLGFVLLRAARGTKARPLSTAAVLARQGPALSGASLSVENVSAVRGTTRVLEGVTFTLAPGQLAFILGTSGGGKSTLLRSILGLQQHTGTVRVAGQVPDKTTTRRTIGYVPQELQLYPNLSALDNLVYFAGQYGISGKDARERATALLGELGLQGRERSTVSKMSGGQQRRVSIAAALIHDPELLILDEPTSGLDFTSRKTLWTVLQSLARQHRVAVLATTHFIDDAQYGDLVGILHQGHMRALGSPRDLVRALPGDGRCVEIEFDVLEAPDAQRLRALVPALRTQGLLERVEFRAFSLRAQARDPLRASRQLPDALIRQGFQVRASRLDDLNLEDVFLHHTGTRPQESTP